MQAAVASRTSVLAGCPDEPCRRCAMRNVPVGEGWHAQATQARFVEKLAAGWPLGQRSQGTLATADTGLVQTTLGGLAHNMEATAYGTSRGLLLLACLASVKRALSLPAQNFSSKQRAIRVALHQPGPARSALSGCGPADVVTSCFHAREALRQRTWTLSQEDAPMAIP